MFRALAGEFALVWVTWSKVRFVRKPVIAEFLNSVCYRAKRPFAAESSGFLVQTAAQRRLAVI
jgi:hypothetical protein